MRNEAGVGEPIYKIIISGGAVDTEGNVGGTKPVPELGKSTSYPEAVARAVSEDRAEYNILTDAPAASQVISSGADVLLVPLDATEEAPVRSDIFGDATGDEAPVESFVLGEMGLLVAENTPAFFWDPVTVSLAVNPSICSDLLLKKIRVGVDPDSGYGRTFESDFGSEVEVCMDIDTDAFYESFADTVEGNKTQADRP